ncbi:hypothetical protein B0H16DRAFT_1888720 [Mycena metata]|uniref:BTB domain-containing protein n=1 Tax=Mycena metata TaxID=1033252 RepID=A0AAD7IRV3_9AGAR|nr:hypothetical protein B0H16DRAFT_1888720 [Mycena metata]
MSDSGPLQTHLEFNHHPRYYFPDGSAIFQLYFQNEPGPLYKLHYSFLGSRSSFFETLFSLPRGPNVDDKIRSEGTADANPIKLPLIVNQFDFDNLLCYIYIGYTNHPKTDAFYVSILKLSTFFQIDDGVTFAIQNLTLKGKDFHPALQFELARLYRVDNWIAPAFRRLMELPITSLNLNHIHQIGQAGYFYLVQTKAHIEAHRKQFGAPLICQVAWAVEWNSSVPRLVHHSEVPVSLVDLMNSLKETEIERLCEGCRRRTVTWIWGTGYVTKEDVFINEAVAALMILQTDEPIRAALRRTVEQPEQPSSSSDENQEDVTTSI